MPPTMPACVNSEDEAIPVLLSAIERPMLLYLTDISVIAPLLEIHHT